MYRCRKPNVRRSCHDNSLTYKRCGIPDEEDPRGIDPGDEHRKDRQGYTQSFGKRPGELPRGLHPLNQLSTVTAPEARLLVIQPWDRSIISEIERSILKSSLGLNPSNDGSVVRIPIPEPTEERRRELVKVVKRHAEESRVAVRNIRRDTIEKIRAMERNKDLSQDESRRNQDQTQKLTDSYISKVDTAAAEKEAEVLEV